MKELDSYKRDEIGVFSEQQKKKELKLIGSLRPQRGQKCWEMNLATGEIVEAVFDKTEVSYLQAVDKDFSVKKKILMRENCVYATAINKKNAIKHFNKILNP